jgi:hypothetical protein
VNRNVCRLAGLKVGMLKGLKLERKAVPQPTPRQLGKRKDFGLRDMAPSSPWFFVSVASKGFSFRVNPLQSTLMGVFVSVADKGLRRIVRVDRLQGPVTPSGMQTAHLQVRRLGAAPHPPIPALI